MGRTSKLTAHQQQEAGPRHEAGEAIAAIVGSYAVDRSMVSRLWA
jgi:hypothetical protein